MTLSAVAAVVSAGGLVVHGASVALAARRGRRKPARREDAEFIRAKPPVSIIQPLCGVEAFTAETLRSIFTLDYPAYEILFCVADPDDPVAAVARRAMAANPGAAAQLLVGDDKVSANPKLNNVVKGWKAARHDWIVIADSNVLMPPDYLQRLLGRWRPNSGVVCAPPIGARPESFAAEIECAFLNTYQARWQYAAEKVGVGFAQGKSMLWRRETLEDGGGVEALGAEIAEDAAATKLIHRAGLRAHLVDAPFPQPLGRRRLKDVWARQLRWARMRRATFPLEFAPEILTTSLLPIGLAAIAAPTFGASPASVALSAAAIWYGLEAALAFASGWPLGWSTLPAMAARDVLLPILWLEAWTGDSFVWRGNAMTVEGDLRDAPAPR